MNKVTKTIKKLDKTVNRNFAGTNIPFPASADLFFKWMPAMYVLTTGLTGVKTKHSFVQKLEVILITEAILNSFVQTFKKSIKRRRPDSLFKYNSFPSGHTATSFAGAVIMYKEINEQSYLPRFAGYISAVTTATLRLYKRKHWLSDIISGAIIGVVSATVAYRFIKNT